ncbi:hypothetical protein DesLBE_1354 [Desulfitobacterium sp. LBE]|uniref:Uncharacterized protein n=1 Tax=Desulfitobacterium hafniense TaxID=49338 RepID=A0A098B6T3_DESHA|nr:hypothetical protein DesLBE_1354 [Desulfitobacterium sp. LBE]CDX03576.1 Hypothetical protein DPCES_3690 [Desulfitobacterium hafniense]
MAVKLLVFTQIQTSLNEVEKRVSRFSASR